MKKPFTLLLLPLLLLGCAKDLPQPTEATSPPVQAQPMLQTVPETREAVPETTTPQEEPTMETQPMLLQDPKDTDFVRVKDYIPDVLEDLKYATADNFTGAVIYEFQDTYLRYGTVKKLMAVQQELRGMGLGLKLWDGFRPVSAQFKLWEICPDDTYVANPNVGYSNHSRGFAVDLTLVDENGNELEMPTAFDDFSGKADRNYAEIPELPRANAQLLETVMQKHGFQGYYGEWWHFNDTFRYDVERVFDPGLISPWQVSGEDPLPLLESPAENAAEIASLPTGSTVTVMGYVGDYALVTWQGLRGYALCIRLVPA